LAAVNLGWRGETPSTIQILKETIMLLVAKRFFRVMFKCMDENNNKFPSWMKNRLNEVSNLTLDCLNKKEN
jgi:hypothetical protein